MNNNLKNNIWFMLISLIMILPILIYAGSSIPAADDYSNSVSVLQYWNTYSSSFVAAIVKSYDLYMNTSGYFFAAFLNFFFAPFLRWGVVGIRVFNVISNIIFFASLFFLVSTFVSYVLKRSSSMTWFLYCMFLTVLVNGSWNSDVYTWYCVQVAYILPISLMLCTFALFIICSIKKRKLYVLTAICAFLVSGSSLNVTALNCGIILLFGGYAFFCLKEKKGSIVVFSSALLGAIVNVASPGNYIRHDFVNENYSVLTSLKNSVVLSINSFEDKVFGSPIFLVAIMVFLISVLYIDYSSARIRFKYPFTAAFIAFMGVVIVNFPVCLGYSAAYLPDRCVFVQDLTIYLLSYLWILYFAGWLRNKLGKIVFSIPTVISTGISFLMIAALMVSIHGGRKSFTTGYMISSILNGSLESYVEYEEGIIDEMKESADDNLIIVRSEKLSNPFFISSGITKDPLDWVNVALAEFYGKESICIMFSDE